MSYTKEEQAALEAVCVKEMTELSVKFASVRAGLRDFVVYAEPWIYDYFLREGRGPSSGFNALKLQVAAGELTVAPLNFPLSRVWGRPWYFAEYRRGDSSERLLRTLVTEVRLYMDALGWVGQPVYAPVEGERRERLVVHVNWDVAPYFRGRTLKYSGHLDGNGQNRVVELQVEPTNLRRESFVCAYGGQAPRLAPTVVSRRREGVW